MLPILAGLIGAGAGAAGASGLAGLTELLGGAAGAEAAGASGGFLSGLTDLLGGATAGATELAGADGAATGSNMMNLLDTAGGKSKKEDKQNEALISAMSSLQSMNASHPKLNLMGRR